MTDRPTQPSDPGRRDFFRRFAGDVVTSVGTVLGAAQALQQQSADAARELLAGDAPAAPALPVPSGGAVPAELDAATAGFRAPFRWDEDVIRLIDQRRLPSIIAEVEVRGPADAVGAIRDGMLVGSGAQAQVAAISLALAASRARLSRPYARRAAIRGAANALATARPGSAPMRHAVDRMLAALAALPDDAEGDLVAATLRAEAEAIVLDAIAAHGTLVTHGLAALDEIPGPGGRGSGAPGPAHPPPVLRILTVGSTGPMGNGQLGTALSVIQAAHHAGRLVHAVVTETRPDFQGSRIAAWELGQAGVPHAVVIDAAAPGLIAAGEIDLVLVAAERVCANGDVVGLVGSYPLALAAAARAIPLLVCASTTTVDLATPDGSSATIERGRLRELAHAGETRIMPPATDVQSPVQDMVPWALVTALVTEDGVLRSPFDDGLASIVARAEAREAARLVPAPQAQPSAAGGAAPAAVSTPGPA